MSNAYFFQTPDPGDVEALTQSFSSLLAGRHERINHYAVSGDAVFGMASPDKFGQGVMPRYLEEFGLWGMLAGELHPCATLDRCRQAYPGADTDLAVLASLARDKRLPETLPTLNGAFFLILWDPESRTLVAANDRYGLYPMYWAHRDGRYCLASRVLGPVLAGVVTGDMDPLAVAQILTVDDFAGDRTLVKDVSVFPPGTVMTKTPDRIDWQTYWTWDYPAEPGIPVEEWGQRAGAALLEAVRRQAGSGRVIGVTLSGGLDSRCVAAAAVQSGLSPRTFTWGEDQCYDRLYAARIARVLGTEHQDCPYEYDTLAERFEDGIAVTEGMCNTFDMHFLAHLHIIAGVDVVLNGFAGDAVLGETFLRAQWSAPMSPAELAENLFRRYNRFLKESELADVMPAARDFRAEDFPLAIFKRQFEELRRLRTPDAAHRYLFDNHVRRKTAMGTVLMRQAAESAACFFDYDFNDLVRRIPTELRASHRTYRAMMRTTFPDVAGIPWQTTLLPPLAPEWRVLASKVVRRASAKVEAWTGWRGPTRRQPPALFAERLRDELRDWMDALIHAEYPIPEALLSPDFVRRVWREHLDGKDRCRLLGALVPVLGLSKLAQRVRNRQFAASPTPNRVKR